MIQWFGRPLSRSSQSRGSWKIGVQIPAGSITSFSFLFLSVRSLMTNGQDGGGEPLRKDEEELILTYQVSDDSDYYFLHT